MFARERPGKTGRHVLRADEVRRFCELLPEWEQLRVGLDAVVLGAASGHIDGWYDDGMIVLAAWEREEPFEWSCPHAIEHAEIATQCGAVIGPHKGPR